MDNLGYGEVGIYGGGVTRGAPTLGHIVLRLRPVHPTQLPDAAESQVCR
jgi:hypothetical protein